MRLTLLDRAVGTTLARDIPAATPGGMPILRAGTKLTDNYIGSLRSHGVASIWVVDDLSQGIEPHELVPPHVREETAHKVSGALGKAQDALVGNREMSGEAAQELKSVVSRLLECIADSPGTALVLMDLASVDAYTYQHSIDVCALGLLIGRRLFDRRGWEDFRGNRRRDDIEGRLLKLGLGLLLHDVGKLAVPEGGSEEDMRAHCESGAQLLDSPAFSPLVRAVVREHHERWDGSGFPRGLKGPRINELARIAAVADAYDNITSDRPGAPGQTPAAGVAAISEGSGTLFDPDVVSIFQTVVVPYPVGSEVTLPDGRVGVVSDVDVDDPSCPVIRFPSPDGSYTEEKLALAA
jgi:HD-GYP domain-containing protein (c-di-GMP phosphodiesterase class II)